MPARLRIASPAATPAPPIQLASTGLPKTPPIARSRSAVCVGSVMAWGARMASRPSLPGSCSTSSTARAYRSASASPRTSTGLAWLQCGGNSRSSAARVGSDSSASAPPERNSSSVASTAGPPALVTIASRGPAGRGCLANASAMWNRSAMRSTRSTPERRKAASSTSSRPASAPVWEAAARAPASVRPGLRTMIGLLSATSRAAERKARASPIVSM